MKSRTEHSLIRRLYESGKLEFLLKGVGISLMDYSSQEGFASTFWKDCGYTTRDLTLERRAELLHPDDRDRTIAALSRLHLGESDFYSGEYRIRDSKGEYRWVRHRALVLERAPEGVPTLYLGVDTDITEVMLRLESEKNEREEMERRYQEAETLRLAGTVVAAGINPRQSIDRILAQSVRVVPADAVLIWATTEDGLDCIGVRGTERLPPISSEGMPKNFSWVLEEKRPRRNFSRPISRGETIYRDSLYVPVVSKGRVLGILEFLGKETRGLGHRAEGPAAIFADSVAIALENALEFRELDREAGADWLTGLPTRRRFDFRARAYLENPREEREFCVLMLDLDKFKEVNDTFGHAVGDEALIAVAHVCREALRSTDLICRYGGEEIAILVPGADYRAGQTVAERIRQDVEELRFPEHPEMRLTVSLGVCLSRAESGNLSRLLGEADRALYQAKALGRNRVVVKTDQQDTEPL